MLNFQKNRDGLHHAAVTDGNTNCDINFIRGIIYETEMER